MQPDPIELYLHASSTAIRDRVLARIRRYVEIETPSDHEDALVGLAIVVEQDLVASGAVVQRIDAPGRGRNLVATFADRNPPGAQPIVTLAHMDTVHDIGTLATRPFTVSNGRASGPGIYDMKAGLALLVESMAWHAANAVARNRPVIMLFTCDEEVGSHSSRGLIDQYARIAAAVLVPEPCTPDGGVKTGRKGVATYRVEVTGRAAHAGIDPGAAVSAIAELVHQSERILEFKDHAKGTTINIGTIEGGSATNVVAAHANAGVDVRLAVAGEDARVHAALMGLTPVHPEAIVKVTLSESRPPLIRNDAVVGVYEKAREFARALGVDLTEGSTGGGSDGSLAAATGAAVLDGLGPRGGGAHAVDEHILIDDLPFRMALLCRLLEGL